MCLVGRIAAARSDLELMAIRFLQLVRHHQRSVRENLSVMDCQERLDLD